MWLSTLSPHPTSLAAAAAAAARAAASPALALSAQGLQEGRDGEGQG